MARSGSFIGMNMGSEYVAGPRWCGARTVVPAREVTASPCHFNFTICSAQGVGGCKGGENLVEESGRADKEGIS